MEQTTKVTSPISKALRAQLNPVLIGGASKNFDICGFNANIKKSVVKEKGIYV